MLSRIAQFEVCSADGDLSVRAGVLHLCVVQLVHVIVLVSVAVISVFKTWLE